MRITEVKVYPVNEEKLKAYVSLTFDDCFVIRDVKVIQGHEGLFVAMPSKRRKDGQFRDIAHPLNQTLRDEIEGQIFQAYQKEIESMTDSLSKLRKAD